MSGEREVCHSGTRKPGAMDLPLLSVERNKNGGSSEDRGENETRVWLDLFFF
jgi:hypothetical protein